MAAATLEVLRRAGYEAIAAADRGHALEIVAGNRFDLLVLDVSLPDPACFEVFVSLSATVAEGGMACVISSRGVRDPAAQRELALRARSFIRQPFDAVALGSLARRRGFPDARAPDLGEGSR
jgi:CheY-like chemotaxis protein